MERFTTADFRAVESAIQKCDNIVDLNIRRADRESVDAKINALRDAVERFKAARLDGDVFAENRRLEEVDAAMNALRSHV